MTKGMTGAVFGAIVALLWLRFGFWGLVLTLVFAALGWIIAQYMAPYWQPFTRWLLSGKDAITKEK